MELKFKTNINCGGCVAQATPHLNQACGVGNWNVDTSNPEKILTVHSDHVSAEQVTKAVEEAGYKIEKVA